MGFDFTDVLKNVSCFNFRILNKPGTVQVGVLSKAQKDSRKKSAYCEIFHLSHSAEKSRKGFLRNSKSFFLHWKHQKK